MCYLKYCFLVFGFFVLQIVTNQEWTRYSTMPEWRRLSIIKSSYDLDNKEVFLVSSSSSLKLWISSDIDTEEEESISNDDADSSDSDILEILSSSVCKLWEKIQLHINTNFVVTWWMLCVIPQIWRDVKYHWDSDH